VRSLDPRRARTAAAFSIEDFIDELVGVFHGMMVATPH
jgi:hypothetical protein